MHKLRLAVIGTGMAWERLHLPALQQLKNYYEIVALSNPSRDRLLQAASEISLDPKNTYEDYHKMLERDDIDVVNIAVPIELNYIVSRDVAKAGLHIICEKPLAPNMEQALDFLELQKRYHVKIMIAENFRYNQENNIIKGLIEEKKIGDVLYFIKNNIANFEEAMVQDTFAAKEWRQHPKFIGGCIVDAGVHDVAAMRYIFGEIEAISAFGTPQAEEYSPYASIHAIMNFKNGVVGNYSYCCKGKELQYPLVGLRIFGTEGTIYLEDKNCGVINVMYRQDNKHEMISFTPEKGYYNEFKDFYDALTSDKEVQVTPNVEFGDLKTVFAFLESAKNKKSVRIDDKLEFITRLTTFKKNHF